LIIAYSSDYNGKGFVGRDRKLVEAKLVALHSDLFCFFEDQCGFYAFFADFIRDLTQDIGKESTIVAASAGF